MARRLLVVFLLVVSFVLSQDFEYIRAVYQNKEVTLAYIDGKEVLALLGNDQPTLERAVSALAQLQLLGELKYSLKDLNWRKDKNKYLLNWDKELIVELSQEEMNINNKRKNDLVKSAKIFETIGGEKIILNNKQDQGMIRTMILYKKEIVSYDGILPAVHSNYPLGTMLRLQNPDTDWTVVIKVVDNDKTMDDGSLGVDENTFKALGVTGNKRVSVQVL